MFFFLCSMGYFLLNNLRLGFSFLFVAIFSPYPLVMIGVELFFLCCPNGRVPVLGPAEGVATLFRALECFLEATPQLVATFLTLSST